ncbi:DUF3800 domain-containing protein [Rhodoferax sp. TS-BS-61-7]|uniref:DUF3800 domain-containing protein n=1 Tax=Rhodoferax sp. TS-BS-61-7 TaxID=2094194 RepID=UPI000CF60DFC|nr:DUF3800 domain-containing protein [Rhodoferax sp. TS-BS-61-7]PQA77951.1 DUF3800 domain-containing protein [Rhodoferax sp. TS-BS-61-7]
MQLIFFDEAKDDDDYPVYHIGGVCIDEADIADVETRISQLAEKSFDNSVLGRDTEFHAAEIFHRKAHFKTWNDFGVRLDLLKEFVGILSLKQVSLIDIQINKAKLHDTQSSSDIAFMFLCERSNQLMRARGKMGMLIGDRDTDSSAARCATSLSSYRVNGTDFQYGQKITNLVDSVHFTHSHLSRFLQLADVYTWLKQFRHRNTDSKNERHQALFNILNDKHADLGPSKYKEWPK